MPGNCPVKQLQPDLAREKRREEKNNNELQAAILQPGKLCYPSQAEPSPPYHPTSSGSSFSSVVSVCIFDCLHVLVGAVARLTRYFSFVAIDMWRCWKIQRLAKNALDACSKHQHDAIWSFVPSAYNLSIFDQSYVPKQQSLHQKEIVNAVVVVSGCTSFARTTVLFAFSIKPSCDSTVTNSCNSETVSANDFADFANNRVSSAKRRSSNPGSPSPKSIFSEEAVPPTFHSPPPHCGK